jgi:hypothetical protein
MRLTNTGESFSKGRREDIEALTDQEINFRALKVVDKIQSGCGNGLQVLLPGE